MILKSILDFENTAMKFLQKVFSRIEGSLNYSNAWPVDHLCYRVETEERYNFFKREFLKISDLLIESPVNGRPISTFRLHQPLHFQGKVISLLELPAPKAGKLVTEGFEHIEMVIDIGFQELIQNNPQIKFKDSGMAKPLNPEIEAKFEDFSVKFHPLPLDIVIELEKKLPSL